MALGQSAGPVSLYTSRSSAREDQLSSIVGHINVDFYICLSDSVQDDKTQSRSFFNPPICIVKASLSPVLLSHAHR